MLPVLLGIGAATVIGGVVLALLDQKTQDHHEHWQRKQGQLHRETAQQRERIQRAMQNSQIYQEYRQYIELHYASVKSANQAYALYQSAKHVLDGLYQQLKISGQKIQSLKVDRQTQQGQQLYSTKQMLKQQYDIHKQIKCSIEVYKIQKDQFLIDVRALNEDTVKLKQYIRYNTGKAGREWYQRLELRTA